MKAKERFVNACLNKTVDRPPVWFMRQAGRYLPEYRVYKNKMSTKQMMTTPEVAATITAQPITILGVDAAILYSDILMIPDAMGMGLNFITGEGPSFDFNINNYESLNKLKTENILEKLSFVFETIKLSLKKLPKEHPLIGFAGGPFTVACYMITGSNKLDFANIKNFAHTQPRVYETLLDLITNCTIDYILEQSHAGVSAIQLFDTWAGQLSTKDYQKLAKPYSQKIFSALQKAYIPSIHYILNSYHLAEELRHIKSDAIGIDWRASLNQWKKITKNQFAIQGNLDPDILMTTPSLIQEELKDMTCDLKEINKGYIINLGHGIKPNTPVKNVKYFVDNAKKIFS